MGNVPAEGVKYYWVYFKGTNEWEKFDTDTDTLIEHYFLQGERKIFFPHRSLEVDFASKSVFYRDKKSRYSIQRRVEYNKETNLEGQNSLLSTFDQTEEYNQLKDQLLELTKELKETVEARDMAISASGNILEDIKGKNEELDRLQIYETELTKMKEELEQKTEETKNLNILCTELRNKLCSEITELEKTLEPKFEEQKQLKSTVRNLRLNVLNKEREIEYIRSTPATPSGSPRSTFVELEKILLSNLTRNSSERSSAILNPYGRRSPHLKSSTDQLPNFAVQIQSPLAEDEQPKRFSGSHEYIPTDKKPPKKFLSDPSMIPISMDKRYNLQIDDLKEKISIMENRYKSLEGDLEIEKLIGKNYLTELQGKEYEMNLLSDQKILLEDEINAQSSVIQEFVQKDKDLSQYIIQLDTKILRLKSRLNQITQSTQSESDSENAEESEETLIFQAQLDETIDQLEFHIQKNQNLKFQINELMETISELRENFNTVEKKHSELENAILKVNSDIKEKEKESQSLKGGNGMNQKLFKALFEDIQAEKTKSLKLSSQITQLSEELKEKNRVLEQHHNKFSLPQVYISPPNSPPSSKSPSNSSSPTPPKKKYPKYTKNHGTDYVTDHQRERSARDNSHSSSQSPPVLLHNSNNGKMRKVQITHNGNNDNDQFHHPRQQPHYHQNNATHHHHHTPKQQSYYHYSSEQSGNLSPIENQTESLKLNGKTQNDQYF